jgi:Fe-Mn family superoxide dismutase
MNYPYSLPELNYSYDDLEPHIDAETMETHHSKHHNGYVTKLNKALENSPKLQKLSLEDLLLKTSEIPSDLKTAVLNNGGGHYNHSVFWNSIGKQIKAEPEGNLGKAINKSFGSFNKFKEQFSESALTLFGSGWVWLVSDEKKALSITTSPNQEIGLNGSNKILLGLDVWEHAYYLKYKNMRADYIKSWWNVVNWEFAESQY